MKMLIKTMVLALLITLTAEFIRAEDEIIDTTSIEVAEATYDGNDKLSTTETVPAVSDTINNIDYLDISIKNENNGIVCQAWVIDKIEISLLNNTVTLYAKGAVTAEDARKGVYTSEIKTSTINDIDISTMPTFLQLYAEVAQAMVLVCPNFQGATIKNTAELVEEETTED